MEGEEAIDNGRDGRHQVNGRLGIAIIGFWTVEDHVDGRQHPNRHPNQDSTSCDNQGTHNHGQNAKFRLAGRWSPVGPGQEFPDSLPQNKGQTAGEDKVKDQDNR